MTTTIRMKQSATDTMTPGRAAWAARLADARLVTAAKNLRARAKQKASSAIAPTLEGAAAAADALRDRPLGARVELAVARGTASETAIPTHLRDELIALDLADALRTSTTGEAHLFGEGRCLEVAARLAEKGDERGRDVAIFLSSYEPHELALDARANLSDWHPAVVRALVELDAELSVSRAQHVTLLMREERDWASATREADRLRTLDGSPNRAMLFARISKAPGSDAIAKQANNLAARVAALEAELKKEQGLRHAAERRLKALGDRPEPRSRSLANFAREKMERQGLSYADAMRAAIPLRAGELQRVEGVSKSEAEERAQREFAGAVDTTQ